MKEGLFELVLKQQEKQQISNVIRMNEKSEAFGLALSEEQAGQLVAVKNETLREVRRVEYADGILPKIIGVFCDSPYLDSCNYAETLGQLQEIFFSYKNEAMDFLTDEELLTFMKEQFDGICCGSAEYLSGTCLERFARAVRAGFDGYVEGEGEGVYGDLTEETAWEKELFFAVWDEMIQ